MAVTIESTSIKIKSVCMRWSRYLSNLQLDNVETNKPKTTDSSKNAPHRSHCCLYRDKIWTARTQVHKTTWGAEAKTSNAAGEEPVWGSCTVFFPWKIIASPYTSRLCGCHG